MVSVHELHFIRLIYIEADSLIATKVVHCIRQNELYTTFKSKDLLSCWRAFEHVWTLKFCYSKTMHLSPVLVAMEPNLNLLFKLGTYPTC